MFSSNTPTGPATKSSQLNKQTDQLDKQLKGPENMSSNIFNTGGQTQNQSNSATHNQDLLNKKKPTVPAFNQSAHKQQTPTMQSFTTPAEATKTSP